MSYVTLMFKFYWRLIRFFHVSPALFKFWQLHIFNVAFFSIIIIIIIIPEIWKSEPSVVTETALPACSLISSYRSVHRHTPCTLLNAIDCILSATLEIAAHLLFCNHIVMMVGDPNLTSGTNKESYWTASDLFFVVEQLFIKLYLRLSESTLRWSAHIQWELWHFINSGYARMSCFLNFKYFSCFVFVRCTDKARQTIWAERCACQPFPARIIEFNLVEKAPIL